MILFNLYLCFKIVNKCYLYLYHWRDDCRNLMMSCLVESVNVSVNACGIIY